jgi:hypothetical protein
MEDARQNLHSDLTLASSAVIQSTYEEKTAQFVRIVDNKYVNLHFLISHFFKQQTLHRLQFET